MSQVREASTREAALLALEALGALKNVADTPAFVGTVYEADADRHIRYRQTIERQRSLYEKLLQQAKDKPYLLSGTRFQIPRGFQVYR